MGIEFRNVRFRVSDDDLDVEDLWVETETNTGTKCTIGIIYRHPKSNVPKFNDSLCNILEQINSDKSIDTCIVTGDFNINLISYDHHYPTERFLDNFISNSFLPSIHLPT